MQQTEYSKGSNIALLIDADNSPADSLATVLTILGDLGTVNIRRAYGNWKSPTLNGWSAIVHRYAIEPHQQFDITKGKNATDMKMTIDAMDLLYTGRVDGFGIMSSDSDFMPIAVRIRQNGIPVYGFGASKTPEGFRQACTRFIDIAAMKKAEEAEAAETTSPAATKGTPARPEVGAELIELLSDAWKASKRDEQGYASLSELGQRVANNSSFDARSYGFSRLSGLIESLPNFAVIRREGVLYVKRVH